MREKYIAVPREDDYEELQPERTILDTIVPVEYGAYSGGGGRQMVGAEADFVGMDLGDLGPGLNTRNAGSVRIPNDRLLDHVADYVKKGDMDLAAYFLYLADAGPRPAWCTR